MFLKKLEIMGFKSFADRAEFSFEPGLTCLVGPNGCGKSNVVDAIKWALGEQSAKSLRGKEMADVIFNGSESRPPSGFAEASLTFDNESGRLPVEYAEVVITRRLYRAGESEYLINQSPARLKDIRELFMDTGLGVQAYSVIEQGRIDLLIQSGATERRRVFEEAAGISKYKARREEAERKLNRVQENLVRLRDIIEEVRKQVRSLRRQAGKARRYKKYSEELKDMRIALTARQYKDNQAKQADAQRTEAELRDGISALNAQIDTIGAEVSRQESAMLQLDERLSSERERLAEAHQGISTAEQKIEYHTQRIAETNDSEARLRERLKTGGAALDELKQQVESSRLEVERLAAESHARQSRCDELNEAVKAAASRRADLDAQLAERKAEVVETLQKTSAAKNELIAVEERSASLRARKERLVARRQKVIADRSRMTSSRDALTSQASEAAAEMETCRAELARATEHAEEERRRLRALDAELISAREDQSSKRSQLQLLADQEAKMEGLREGVRDVLKASEEGRLGGIGPMVGTVLQADLAYATAIDAALAERAQIILAENTECALGALGFLKEHRGHAAFMALDRLALQPPRESGIPGGEGIVGRAADLVRCDDSYRPIAEYFLGDVLIVRDIDTAMRLVMDGGRRFRIATLDGDMVERSGLVSGGVSEGAGMISRRSTMAALAKETAALGERIARLRHDRDERLRALRETDSMQAALRERIDAASVLRAERAKEAEQLETLCGELQEELDVITGELDETEKESASMTERALELKSSLQTLEENLRNVEENVADLESKLQEADGVLARKNEELTRARVARAQLAERRDSAAGLHKRQIEELRNAEMQMENIQREIAECGQRLQESERIISESRTRLAELMEQTGGLEERIADLERERGAVRETLESGRARLRELNSQLRARDEEIQSVRLKLNEYRLRAEGMLEKIRDDYNVDLAERLPEFEDADIDYEMLPAQIEELRAKMEKMGSVNLQAIDELEEAEGRADFLAGQESDLISAKNKLQEVIRKINRESRERFEKTFNDVRGQFQVIFRQLFGGGKADVKLEEGVDVLEAGVEINARPPGKQMRSITLLSGGEKVLTAIALVFALFKARPSPFAILDEVDAALDDTNIGRFLILLKDFLKRSQFVIISHNKQTMASADILYGVTMQEHGVSKKVAVRFEDIETHVA